MNRQQIRAQCESIADEQRWAREYGDRYVDHSKRWIAIHDTQGIFLGVLRAYDDGHLGDEIYTGDDSEPIPWASVEKV